MTKVQAIRLFGSVKALADALRITPEAVYQWPKQVPKLREYEIREIRVRMRRT